MKCSNCKQKVSGTEKYCSNCGSEIKINKSGKHKKLLITLCCVMLAVLVVSGSLIIFHLTQKNSAIKSEATSTVTSFLDAYHSKSGDANNYLTFTSMDGTDINYEGYQGYCAERISYKIVDTDKNDSNLVTVTVEIENIDLATVLNNLTKTSLDNDEEIIDYFYSTIKSDDVPTKTYKCNIKCKEYPTGMKILFDAELSNALLGGYSAYVAGNNE